MLTRTSAAEMLEQDRILMTAAHTGWITDERPHPTKLHGCFLKDYSPSNW